jgi:hypothetical protein
MVRFRGLLLRLIPLLAGTPTRRKVGFSHKAVRALQAI